MKTDANDLFVFVRVVESGGFSAAARTMGVPTSTVSRRIGRLEEALDARLLQRTTRKVSLTDVGQRFYERAAQIVADIDEAERDVAALHDEPRGLLRISIPAELNETLEPILVGFLNKYKEVRLEVDASDRYVDLVEERFDVALRAGRLADSSLIAVKLMDSEVRLFASPSYIEHRGEPTSPKELIEHDCCLFGPLSAGTAWALQGPNGSIRVPVKGRMSANSMILAKAAVVAGLGIGMLPTNACCDEVVTGKLQIVLPDYGVTGGSVSLVYPSRRHVPAKLSAFVDHVRDGFRDAMASFHTCVH